MKIRVMPDYECAPSWDDEDVGPIDPNELPISCDLAELLWAWAREYDATLNWDDSLSSGFETTEDELRFTDAGRALNRRLSKELSGFASVRWWRDVIPTSCSLEDAARGRASALVADMVSAGTNFPRW